MSPRPKQWQSLQIISADDFEYILRLRIKTNLPNRQLRDWSPLPNRLTMIATQPRAVSAPTRVVEDQECRSTFDLR
jgi:hypothetical protein